MYAFSRCMVDDVKQAIDCGVGGVIMEVPSSRHLIELGYRWSVERAIDLSIESTAYAHDNGLEVSFFPIDATRPRLEDYLNLVQKVADEGHMDALVLVDTMGVLTPHAVEPLHQGHQRTARCPPRDPLPHGLRLRGRQQPHRRRPGASAIQTTIGGIGERAGNCPMEEAVMALLTLYNRDIGIDTTKLTDIHRFVMDLAGVQQPSNRPVTGDRLFAVESGIIATWVRNARDIDPVEAVPYHPSLVGQPGPDIVLGKGSGLDSIAEALQQTGTGPLDDDTALEVLTAVKAAALDKRDLLTLDEFKTILADTTHTTIT